MNAPVWFTLLMLPISMIWFAMWRRVAGGWLGRLAGWGLGGTVVTRALSGAGMGFAVISLLLSPQASLATHAALLGACSVAYMAGMAWGYPRLISKPAWQSHMCPQNGPETLILVFNCIMHAFPLLVTIALFSPFRVPWSVDLLALALVGAGGAAYHLAAAQTPRWRVLGFEEWAPDQKQWIIQPRALAEVYEGFGFGAAVWVLTTLPRLFPQLHS